MNYLKSAFDYLRRTIGLPMMILAAVVVSYFVYSSVREWRLKNAIERQNERMDQYGRDTEAAIANANKYLEIADRNHEAATALIEVVDGLTENVKTLAEQDRVINLQVSDLRSNYENARNQNRSVNPQPDLSLGERESRVLATDAELYPE